MKKKFILLVALLPDISVMAMDHIKEMPPGKETSRNEEEIRVKICLIDSAHSDTPHEVEIPVRLAKLIGALNNDLMEDSKTKDSIFPLPNMTLAEWQLIEPLLERVYDITHEEINADPLRKEIIAEYNKLDAKSLIELIRALDYADIPLLLEIACNVVKQSALDKISWEELELLPGHIRNLIIMYKVLMLHGPAPVIKLAVCKGHRRRVTSVCVTDGKIVSGSDDNTVRIWDMQGNQLAECRGHQGEVTSVCITADGKIVSGSRDKTVRVWDMQGNLLVGCSGSGGFISVCVTKEGRIVAGSNKGTMLVWDMESNQLAVCKGHERGVASVCVTKGGRIISGSADNTMRIWDKEGNPLAICRGHKDLVRSVCIANDGNIVSGSWDKTIRVWDMQGKELAIFRGHGGAVTSVCVTGDGKIVSGSLDKTVRVWDMNGNQLAEGRDEDSVYSVCITQDGKIVSGSEDNTVCVWNIRLLRDIVWMDEDRAQALWAYVRQLPDDFDKQAECWREIEKIVETDASMTTNQNQ